MVAEATARELGERLDAAAIGVSRSRRRGCWRSRVRSAASPTSAPPRSACCSRQVASVVIDAEVLARSSASMLAVAAELSGPDHALDSARTLTAWANGFVSMELSGAFRLGGDVERAFEFGVHRLADALAARPA